MCSSLSNRGPRDCPGHSSEEPNRLYRHITSFNNNRQPSSCSSRRKSNISNWQSLSSQPLNSIKTNPDLLLSYIHPYRSNSSSNINNNSSNNGLRQIQPPIYLRHKHKPLHSSHPLPYPRRKHLKHRHHPHSKTLLKARLYLFSPRVLKPSLLLLLLLPLLYLRPSPNRNLKLSLISPRTQKQEGHACRRNNR